MTWMAARAKILVDGRLVWMYGSLTFLACEVHAVSYAADGIEPFNMPLLSCSVVMGLRGFWALAMGVDIGGGFP